MSEFALLIKVRQRGVQWSAKCPLGLWSVSGADKAEVVREAQHYFGQYLSDGEYQHLLAQPNPEKQEETPQ